MARIRTIKPEITTDEKLARVSRDARLTFIFAITQADDDGLLPGNSRQLLAALYPTDSTVTDVLLANWLTELTAVGVLRWRETIQGAPILEVTNWNTHQKISNRGKSLLLPALRRLSADPLEDRSPPSVTDPHTSIPPIPVSGTPVSPIGDARDATAEQAGEPLIGIARADVAVLLCCVHNHEMAARFPAYTMFAPTAGTVQEVAAAWLAAGVSADAIEAKMRSMAAAVRKRPIASPLYYRDAVLEAWDAEQGRRPTRGRTGASRTPRQSAAADAAISPYASHLRAEMSQ